MLIIEQYYTPNEIAEKLNVNAYTIIRYIKAGKIKAKKLGKGYRIAEADLMAFLK